MALVKVQWSETREYEAEIEIDGFDPLEHPEDQLADAVGELSSEAHDDAELDGAVVKFEHHEIVRAGEAPVEVVAPRRQYEADF